jgi:hypothetical protein
MFRSTFGDPMEDLTKKEYYTLHNNSFCDVIFA